MIFITWLYERQKSAGSNKLTTDTFRSSRQTSSGLQQNRVLCISVGVIHHFVRSQFLLMIRFLLLEWNSSNTPVGQMWLSLPGSGLLKELLPLSFLCCTLIISTSLPIKLVSSFKCSTDWPLNSNRSFIQQMARKAGGAAWIESRSDGNAMNERRSVYLLCTCLTFIVVTLFFCHSPQNGMIYTGYVSSFILFQSSFCTWFHPVCFDFSKSLFVALSLPDCLYCVRHESSDERVELFCFAFALLFHPFVVITGCLLHSSMFNVAPPVVASHEQMFKKVTTFQSSGSRVDTRPTVSGLCLQSTFSFRSDCSSATNSLLCSCCSAQAPAPVAFPMTTPQVPVYGMVKSRLISESFHSFSAGINPLLIWFGFCLLLTCPPSSSLLRWVIRWGAFPWCPHSLSCTTSLSWDPPILLGPSRGHR